MFCLAQAMVGTGEALLNVRARGGGQPVQAGSANGASAATAQEFDFQSELQKFDKVGWSRGDCF